MSASILGISNPATAFVPQPPAATPAPAAAGPDLATLERLNCCETPEVGITWNSAMHKSIVSTAVEGLKSITDPALKPHVDVFLKRWANMQANLEQGLDDADSYFKWEYTDGFFSTHFYDPDTRGTWGANPGKNALSEGSRRYFEATRLLETGAPDRDFGYALGLALHYLTDLTQPMHAANFIMIPTIDHRHTNFEAAADAYTLSTPTYGPFDLGQWRSPGQILRETAIQAKRVYTNTLQPLLQKKSLFGTFTLEEVTPTMQAVEAYALRMTATFILCAEIGRLGGTVHTIYWRLLKRGADAEGLRNWGGMLASGRPVKDVILGVIGGDEFLGTIKGIAQTDVAAATRALYDRCLARAASDAEVREWEGWMKTGRYYDSARYMIDSAEYDQRFGPHIVPY